MLISYRLNYECEWFKSAEQLKPEVVCFTSVLVLEDRIIMKNLPKIMTLFAISQ